MAWRRFFRRGRWDDERRAELEAHLQIEIDDNLARGLPPDEARAAAYRTLGNPTLIREEIYGMNSIGWLEVARQDVKYALRVLRKSPSFTLVALMSLSLGIGANAAIFQLLDAVTLRALPLPAANRLVEYKIDTHGKGRTGGFFGERPNMSYPLFERLRDAKGLGRVFAWGTGGFELAEGGESQPARGLYVSGSLFDVAGVRPAAGRLLGPSDDQPGCGNPSAVLSHAFWQKKFGADPTAIGRPIALNGVPFRVAGVADASFFGFEVGRSFDVAVPMCSEPLLRTRSVLTRGDSWWLSVMARLDDGESVETAGARAAAMSSSLFASSLPPTYGTTDAASYKAFALVATPVGTGVSQLRGNYAQPLELLLGIAGLVLLIACGNLANLMLARASVRQSEMAVRLAIGASRGRLIRQLMVESLLVAAGGALAGTLIAGMLSRSLVAYLDSPSPYASRVFVNLGLDWRVIAFTSALAAVTCVLFGLAPAFRATRTNPAQVMRASGRGATDGRDRFNVRRFLVVGQIALSLVLVVGALLFGGTLRNLATIDPGFNTAGVTAVDVDFRNADVPADQLLRFQIDLADRMARTPGVAQAALVNIIPLTGNGWNESLVIDGKENREVFPDATRVAPAFFDVMRMPIVAGRNFDDRDTLNAPRVAIVTENFGRTYFATPQPIGRQFHIAARPGEPDPAYTVVGVVHDIKYRGLKDEKQPVMFFPYTQETAPDPGLSVVFRGTADAAAAIARAVRDVHPRIIVTFSNVDEVIATQLVRERLMATLSGFFGAVAALLAAVGLYGVISYLVERRRAEIGIRMALGADRPQVIGLFMRESAWLVGAGLVIGAVLAYYAARSAATLLFGLTASSPQPFAIAAALLAFIALAAAFVPALRAARQAPTTALRG